MENDLIRRKDAYDSLLNGMVMTGHQSRALDCIAEYSIPAVDAVPVVRCRDCKHKRTATGCCAYVLPDMYGIGTEVLYCPAIERYVEHDFFCKYGKKVTE